MMKLEIMNHFQTSEQYNLIETLCDKLLEDIEFTTECSSYQKQREYYNRSIYHEKSKQYELCHARIWNDHRGGRCSNKIKVNDQVDYEIEHCLCQRHSKLVKKNRGELYYGLYSDPLPDKPTWNINKPCPLGKRLNWYCSK